MSEAKQTLFQQLTALCAAGEAFYHKDYEHEGSRYRVFSYRIPSYAAFLQPGALEARGIMFEIDEVGNVIRCASRPMEKFFNLNENPLTMNLDLTKLARVMEKRDGSLMSSFTSRDGRVYLKSKTSLYSPQALDATAWLHGNAQRLADAIAELSNSNHTVNLEWTAPHNRIVLKYQEPQLTVLNVRHNVTGDYMKLKTAWQLFPVLKEYWVNGTCMDRLGESERMIYSPESIKRMEGIEGFVYVMENGQMVKVKTDWYLNLHRAKDRALNFKAVVEAIVTERLDDLKALMADDLFVTKFLNRVESKVAPWVSSAIGRAEGFYATNRSLDRKSYAVKASQEANDIHGLVMALYLGRDPDYLNFTMKRIDELKKLAGVEGFNGLADD